MRRSREKTAIRRTGNLPRKSTLLRSLAGVSFSTAACSQGVLDPQGPIAAAEKTILLNSVGIMLVIVIPVILATLAVAWWYRASNKRALYRPDWDYSGKIEIVVWSIPAMTILLLGGIAWISSRDLAPEKPIAARAASIDVQVVSLDWKWLFIYPGHGIASVNRLVVPVGAPIRLRLTSASVMNSFFVPQLGSQIYTMAGMTTRLHLLADHPGSFPGLSSQFSGDGFSGMRFMLEAVPEGQFEAWVARTRSEMRRLDGAGYAALAKPSKYVAPITYGAVDPGLFERIVAMKPAGMVTADTFPASSHASADSEGH